MKKRLLVILLITAVCFSFVSCTKESCIKTSVDTNSKDYITYGNLTLKIKPKKFLKYFDINDIVTAQINDSYSFSVPVCENYEDVPHNELLIRIDKTSRKTILAKSYGNLASDLSIEGPISVTLTLKEKNGYFSSISSLKESLRRKDYNELSDSDFANFREVKTKNIKEKTLYRSSNPIDPQLRRNKYADKLCKETKIKTIINLNDSKASASKYIGFNKSYYSKQNVLYLPLSISFESKEFEEGLKECLKFIISNEGPYLIHCTQGKDRTGFICAVIEALCGSSLDEIKEDYLLSYKNFYKTANDEITNVLVNNLSKAFNTEDLENNNLRECAFDYLLRIGLDKKDIDKLKDTLALY